MIDILTVVCLSVFIQCNHLLLQYTITGFMQGILIVISATHSLFSFFRDNQVSHIDLLLGKESLVGVVEVIVEQRHVTSVFSRQVIEPNLILVDLYLDLVRCDGRVQTLQRGCALLSVLLGQSLDVSVSIRWRQFIEKACFILGD